MFKLFAMILGNFAELLGRRREAPLFFCDDNRPEIVCLCGSTRFIEDFQRKNEELTLNGKIVLTVAKITNSANSDVTPEDKERLDVLHKRKIDLADYVIVINKLGYIGPSTESEIAHACLTGKPVHYEFPTFIQEMERVGIRRDYYAQHPGNEEIIEMIDILLIEAQKAFDGINTEAKLMAYQALQDIED